MIHIVHNEADVAVMQQVQELDETLAGDILLLRDDYAVGPLENIFTPEGAENRRNWWREILAGGDYENIPDSGLVNDEQLLADLKTRLDADAEETVWIWAGQNKHDVCGYYWLTSQLKDYAGRIYIIYLNNLPFINDKGQLFYPQWLSEIQPKEFLKAKKLSRRITPAEFEVDPDEWAKICASGKMVRLLEGGKKLQLHDVDFYDSDLKRFVTGDFQKASRIITQFLNKNKNTTGDGFLLWRLKQIAAADENFELQGEPKKMKDFDLRNKNGIKKFVANAEGSEK